MLGRLRWLLVVAIVAGACGDATGDGSAAPGPSAAAPTTFPGPTEATGASAPADQSAPVPATTDTAALATATAFEGEAAPDFRVALENRSGDFVLSEEATPVYLVFWAEW